MDPAGARVPGEGLCQEGVDPSVSFPRIGLLWLSQASPTSRPGGRSPAVPVLPRGSGRGIFGTGQGAALSESCPLVTLVVLKGFASPRGLLSVFGDSLGCHSGGAIGIWRVDTRDTAEHQTLQSPKCPQYNREPPSVPGWTVRRVWDFWGYRSSITQVGSPLYSPAQGRRVTYLHYPP